MNELLAAYNIMCLAIYIASDEPLPLVAWSVQSPAFHVIDLSEREQVVRKQFANPFVYYVGTYEGCGCAFNYGREYPEYEDNPEELKFAEESVTRLADYLSDAVSKVGSVQVFSCWEGESEKPPEHFREIVPDKIRQKDFIFRVPELLTITVSATSLSS